MDTVSHTPCAFCGSGAQIVGRRGRITWIECVACGCLGPWAMNVDQEKALADAKEAWATRAVDQDLLAVAQMVAAASELSGVTGPLAEAARAAIQKAESHNG